jgi:hypothetical protein
MLGGRENQYFASIVNRAKIVESFFKQDFNQDL